MMEYRERITTCFQGMVQKTHVNTHDETRTKKVVFIVSRLTQGGTERACLNAAIACQKSGMQVYIIVREADREVTYQVPDGIEVVSLGMDSELGLRGRVRRIGKLAIALDGINPDWVIAFNHAYTNLLVTGTFFKYKTVTSERFYPKEHYRGRPIAGVIGLCAYSLSTRVVFQTEENRNYYGSRIRAKSAIIPNAIPQNLPAYVWRPDRKVITTACRLEPQKNVIMLLDAFYLFNQVHQGFCLRVFGTGSLEVQLKERAESLGISENVEFFPFCADLHERMLDASMFVSSSDYEGIQNSLLEAIGMGIPSVATDCLGGGARLLIGQNERGILVPRGDAATLAAGMMVIVEQPELARYLSEQGKSLKEKYSVDAISAKWARVLS